jgi:Secretion system C-terminal sorting domain
MKIIIIIVAYLLCISGICFTQNQPPLTVREVYDFAVGDTFQYYLQGNCLYYTGRTVQIVILDKWYSAKKDTVFYKQKYERYGVEYPSNRPIYIDYERKELTISYTHLDSAINYNFSKVNCPITNTQSRYCRDSIYNAYNKRNTYFFKREIVATVGSTFEYSQGLGRTLNKSISEDPCGNQTEELIYFHKVNEIWGASKPIISSDNTPSVYNKIKLSPNPAKGIIYLETEIDFDKIQIIDLNGQVVLSENKTHQVSISDLSNGIYFMQIFKQKTLICVNKIIVNH